MGLKACSVWCHVSIGTRFGLFFFIFLDEEEIPVPLVFTDLLFLLFSLCVSWRSEHAGSPRAAQVFEESWCAEPMGASAAKLMFHLTTLKKGVKIHLNGRRQGVQWVFPSQQPIRLVLHHLGWRESVCSSEQIHTSLARSRETKHPNEQKIFGIKGLKGFSRTKTLLQRCSWWFTSLINFSIVLTGLSMVFKVSHKIQR